ncbi:MAG: hypothetical protein ABII00_08770 [Elusimicrobiota bacterium]
MLELVLMLSLTSVFQAETQTAQFKPCIFPNKCSSQTMIQTAAVRPCIWPNTCGDSARPLPVLVKVRPCVWPNSCGEASPQI